MNTQNGPEVREYSMKLARQYKVPMTNIQMLNKQDFLVFLTPHMTVVKRRR